MIVALVYALFIAPNAMIIRVAVQNADPYYLNAVRFLIVVVACLPFVVKHWRALWHADVRKWIIGSALAMTTAIIAYTSAIQQSQASYVSILALVSPIVLVVLSAFLTKDVISKRAVAGVTLAAFGATVIVLLPIAISQQGVGFYPFATFLSLVNSVCFSFAIICIRRANERHVPLVAIIGVNAMTIAIVSFILFLMIGDTARVPADASFWIAVLYSGVGVSFLARMVSVVIFERNGAAFISAVTYFETFVAILLPVIILREKLSAEMVVGGMLILGGVYVIESHKHLHAKHHFIWHHH